MAASYWVVIGSAIAACGTIIAGVIAGLFLLRKNRADAASLITDAAVKLLKEERDARHELRRELEAARLEIVELRIQLSSLRETLRQHNIETPTIHFPARHSQGGAG